jgi:predicted  nucleic acid-binding Zn-ribbon protein
MSDIESLKSENQKLREYISLISSEIEFNDRVHEIKQNFKDSPDLERIIVPILDRINKIKSEKSSLTTELNLN